MTIVRTPSGDVRGTSYDGVRSFLGLPYAEAPVGPLRWRAPRPARPWTGVRDATTHGPAAPQPVGGPLAGLVPGMAVGAQGEDCLHVSIWAPEGASDLPVVVWLHGGAFVLGSPALPVYDGALLSREQQVVVIGVGYRLGALGWLTGVDGVDSNCGLRDQLLALAWVRDHIASFGGDPTCVTVVGESAGAGSVVHLLASPAAEGLLHRAVAQSPGAGQTLPPALAAQVGAALLAELGDHDLQTVALDDLLAAQSRVADSLLMTVGSMPFHPAVDGDVLPRAPLAPGDNAAVPLLAGTTSEEMRLFADPALSGLDRDTVVAILQPLLSAEARRPLDTDAVGRAVDGYLARGGVHGVMDVRDAFAGLATDQVMRLPVGRLMDLHPGPVYAYDFTWRATGAGFDVGACHGVDIPFVFGGFDVDGWDDWVGDVADAKALSGAVREAWASFARDGVPSAKALPTWPPYDAEERLTMALGRTVEVVADPLTTTRAACRELAP